MKNPIVIRYESGQMTFSSPDCLLEIDNQRLKKLVFTPLFESKEKNESTIEEIKKYLSNAPKCFDNPLEYCRNEFFPTIQKNYRYFSVSVMEGIKSKISRVKKLFDSFLVKFGFESLENNKGEEKMKNELKDRETYYTENMRIVKNGGLFTVQEKDSHYSDSTNPKGDWMEYWSEVKTYKTINGAKKGLVNRIKCHFPAGHNIDKIINAILAKMENEAAATDDNPEPETTADEKDMRAPKQIVEDWRAKKRAEKQAQNTADVEPANPETDTHPLPATEKATETKNEENAKGENIEVFEPPKNEIMFPFFEGVEVKAFQFGKKLQRIKLIFTGDTKPHKEDIKKLGKAWWNGALSRWEVDITDTPLAANISFVAPQAA